jgi:hypothetical protein
LRIWFTSRFQDIQWLEEFLLAFLEFLEYVELTAILWSTIKIRKILIKSLLATECLVIWVRKPNAQVRNALEHFLLEFFKIFLLGAI